LTPLFLSYTIMARPFTEEEDQIIILCLAKATSSNVSDALRKASTLTGRSFNSIYSRYYQKNKFDEKAMKKEKQDFEDWKLVHQFFYGETVFIKTITLKDHNNIFKQDWRMLMELVKKIEDLGYNVNINTAWTTIGTRDHKEPKMISSGTDNTKKFNTYYACVGFIKWLNKKNEK